MQGPFDSMNFHPNYQANPAASPPSGSVAGTAGSSSFPAGSPPPQLFLPSPQHLGSGSQAAAGPSGSLGNPSNGPGSNVGLSQTNFLPGQQLLLPPPEQNLQQQQQQYPTQYLESGHSYPSNVPAEFPAAPMHFSGASPTAFQPQLQLQLPHPNDAPPSQGFGFGNEANRYFQGSWGAAPATLPPGALSGVSAASAGGPSISSQPPLFLPQPEQGYVHSYGGQGMEAAGAFVGPSACAAAAIRPQGASSPTAGSPERTSTLAVQNPTAASPPPASPANAAACRADAAGGSTKGGRSPPTAGYPDNFPNADPQQYPGNINVGATPAIDCGDGNFGRLVDDMGGGSYMSGPGQNPSLPLPLPEGNAGSPIDYHVPSEEDTDHWKAQMSLRDARLHSLIYLLGLISFFAATSLVVIVALTLLFDHSYIFWMGGSTPTLLVALASSVFLLYAVLGMTCLKCVNMDRLGSCTIGFTAAFCSIALGVGLLLLVARGHRELVVTTEAVATGCFKSAVPSELAVLAKTSEALHDLRSKRVCSRNLHESVEECSEFEETKYSMYLRYLEQELGCNSICPEVGLPHTAHLTLAQSFLQDDSVTARARRTQSKKKSKATSKSTSSRTHHKGRGRGETAKFRTSLRAGVPSPLQVLSTDSEVRPSGEQNEEAPQAAPNDRDISDDHPERGGDEQEEEEEEEEEEKEERDEDEDEDEDLDPDAWASSGSSPLDASSSSYSEEETAQTAPSDSERALAPGDAVLLSDDLYSVRQAFHGEYCLTWDPKMESMLGKLHQVVSVLPPSTCGKSIGVRSPNGSQDGVWYFPVSLFVRATLPSSRSHSNWLFSTGRNPGRVCYPMMASQLQGSTILLGSGVWLQGWLLVGAGVMSLLLGIYATVMNKIA